MKINWKLIKGLFFNLSFKKLKEILQSSCEHSTVIPISNLTTKYNLTKNRHTRFILLKCIKCNFVYGFPAENYKLAVKEGTPETIEKIAELIKNA
jgi:acetone carboxylase gamma subunit